MGSILLSVGKKRDSSLRGSHNYQGGILGESLFGEKGKFD